ncbi:MAG: peptidylprolyl isomerase [Chitinophagales bacterium]|nr:peptidylprolyl isomerase [Chitinophagales bacterium]
MKKVLIVLPLLLLLSFKPKEKMQTVIITTEFGDIKLKLYNETPKHRDNFIHLVETGVYDSLLFHRVISDFMIQGGDPDSKNAVAGSQLGSGEVKGVPRVPAEFNAALIHKKGALAAARDNNPEKASSNCQFYIVQGKKSSADELNSISQKTGAKYTDEQKQIYETVGGTPFLDMNYTVYGEVIEGLNIIDSIAAVPKDRNDRPLKDVRMTMKMGKPMKVK